MFREYNCDLAGKQSWSSSQKNRGQPGFAHAVIVETCSYAWLDTHCSLLWYSEECTNRACILRGSFSCENSLQKGRDLFVSKAEGHAAIETDHFFWNGPGMDDLGGKYLEEWKPGQIMLTWFNHTHPRSLGPVNRVTPYRCFPFCWTLEAIYEAIESLPGSQTHSVRRGTDHPSPSYQYRNPFSSGQNV